MTTQQADTEPHIVSYKSAFPDELWFRVHAGKDFDAQASDLAAKQTDTAQARAFLTESLVRINHETMHREARVAFVWVPDRQVGEIVVFGFPTRARFRTAAEATAQAYAKTDPHKDAGRKFKILDHATGTTTIPAGELVYRAVIQRERGSLMTSSYDELTIFPPVEGIREAFRLTFFTTHLDIGSKITEQARMIANSVELTIGHREP